MQKCECCLSVARCVYPSRYPYSVVLIMSLLLQFIHIFRIEAEHSCDIALFGNWKVAGKNCFHVRARCIRCDFCITCCHMYVVLIVLDACMLYIL